MTYAAAGRTDLELRIVSHEDDDVQSLSALLDAEYSTRYGSVDSGSLSARERSSYDAPEVVIVGYVDDRPVAMGAWRRHGPRGDAEGEIRRMFVVSTHRGRGHAPRVLAKLEASAASSGVQLLVLETSVWLPEGLSLYRSAGYVKVDPFGAYAGYDGVVHLGKRL